MDGDLYEEYLKYVTERANKDMFNTRQYSLDEVREWYKDREVVMRDLIMWMMLRKTNK